MAAPLTYTGASWTEIAAAQFVAENAASGSWPDPKVPRLSNGEALAILQAWRGIAIANKVAFPFWPELWYHLLGYERPGDKFKITIAHFNTQAPLAYADATWAAVIDVAAKLDKIKAPTVPLVLNRSQKGLEAAAAVAWDQMKRERATADAKIKIPYNPNKPGDTVDVDKGKIVDIIPDPRKAVPKLPSMGGAGMLLVLLVIAFAVKDK